LEGTVFYSTIGVGKAIGVASDLRQSLKRFLATVVLATLSMASSPAAARGVPLTVEQIQHGVMPSGNSAEPRLWKML
jgi:hypothetical protein